MIQHPSGLGLILIQEVGFDIVALWPSWGYLAIAVMALATLAALGFVVFAVSSILKRRRGTSK